MARPRKQGIDYFPLDVDFFSDEKIVCVSGEFGLKGEIALIKLLCAVYRNGYYLLWDDKTRATLLHQLPGVGADMLQQLVLRLVRWGIFSSQLYESDAVLTSAGIQKRFFEVARKRAPQTDYPYLLIEPQNYALRRQTIRVGNSKDVVSESKTDVSVSEIPPKKVVESVNIVDYAGPSGDGKTVSASETGVSDAKTPGFRAESTQSKVYNNIIKENNIKKDGNGYENTSASAEAIRRIDIEAGEMKTDISWAEVVCMKYGVAMETFVTLIDEFSIHCKTRVAAHCDTEEAKRHFCSWLDLKRKDGSTNGINGTKARTASRIRTAAI